MYSKLVRLAILGAAFLVAGVAIANAAAAITITRSELNSGQLRVEGNGALANARVTVNPGAVTGTSDSNGAFKIQSSPYSSSDCRITVSDGVSSASASLSGCTPSSSTPPTSAPAVSLSPTSLTFGAQDL